MKTALLASVLIAFSSGVGAAQIVQSSYSKLLGTWTCSTSFEMHSEDGKSITRVRKTTVFADDGMRSDTGTIQWFDASSSVRSDFSSESAFALYEDTLIIDLISLEIREPKVRHRAATTRDPLTEFANGLGLYKDYSLKSVLNVIELNDDRFGAIANEGGTYSLCFRKGQDKL